MRRSASSRPWRPAHKVITRVPGGLVFEGPEACGSVGAAGAAVCPQAARAATAERCRRPDSVDTGPAAQGSSEESSCQGRRKPERHFLRDIMGICKISLLAALFFFFF